MVNRFELTPMRAFLKHRKEFFVIDDAERYKRVTVRLHAQGVVLRDEVYGSQLRTKKQQATKAGDLLVAEIDAKVGGVGIVPPALAGAIVSSHYFLYEIDETICHPRYLEYFIRSGAVEQQFQEFVRGSTNYASIRAHHTLELQIPLASMDEQRHIVARIEELAALIEEAQELRAKAREEAEALWESNAQAVLTELTKDGMQPLQDLVTVMGGGTPSKSNPYFWEGTIPWIRPQNMKTREIRDSTDYITENAIRNSSARLIDPGAVLVVVRGMILAHTVPSAVLRVVAAVNQDMKALIPVGGLMPEYLCTILWALNQRLLSLVKRSTHGTCRLLTPELLDFEIPVPSVSKQRRIVAYLDGLQAQVNELATLQDATQAELDALLPSVLDRAFRGEL